VKTLDPYTIPLQSINLIEASAGTGKSWTVTLLYLRLILEKALTVDQILVVTFTEAATKELRDVVRSRIIEALDFFQNPDQKIDKKEYAKLYNKQAHGSDREAILRLTRAKLSMDEAAIFTIHSFCQRVLNEYAFEASLAFENELLDSDRELMQKLTDDFWRRNFYKASKPLLSKLQKQNITPDAILDDIWAMVGKPYLQISGPLNPHISDVEWSRLSTLFKQALSLWADQCCEIRKLLIGNKNLNGNSFRPKTLEKNCNQLNEINSLTDINKELLENDLKRFKASCLKAGTKNKCETPCHPFFELWESFSDLWEDIDSRVEGFIAQIKIDCMHYLQTALSIEKKRLGVLAFDDLLLQLQQALQNNPKLAHQLNNKYKAALIDEFQDTDPVQYEIFSRIYQGAKDSVVFLVGDPKQAIYSFRGGDIYTYLKAKSDTNQENHATLDTNWRSHPDLIKAFNALYGACDNPFQDEGIDYVQVKAGLECDQGIAAGTDNTDKTPLRFWQYYPETDEKGEVIGGMEAIREAIAESLAGEIAQRLNSDSTINGKPVSGADIAILVRSHTQGDLIKAALNARGIASVQSSNQSIFQTHEAAEMQRLLTAIIEPQQEDNVRRALVTDMLGCQAEDLIRFENDSSAWENNLLAMQRWQQCWKQDGFLPMMRQLMREASVHQRLLAYDDGERRVTNIVQLAELIHHASRQQSLGMEEVLRWLRQQQENAGQKESELRLESDENLVKIVTIHKSKGLEYPIVYCPFVGLNNRPNQDKVYTFYKDGKPSLEIGSPEAEEHKKIKTREEQAEATRLLYVALTRAKYQCTVVCLPKLVKRNPDKTALGWLITNGETTATAKDKEAFEEAYRTRLDKLASENKGIIKLTELPVFPANLRYQSKQTLSQLTARAFTAKIRAQAQITSFSGLTAGIHEETPDYDNAFANSALEPIDLPKAENEFPRGATAGIALHEIFENLDFVMPVTRQEGVITNALNKWAFDEKYRDSASLLIENSLGAELFNGFALNQLANDKRLNEMEFYLPLQRLHIDDLRQILFQHLPESQQAFRDAVNSLYFDQVEGYLKGFIDLVFEHQGKYYLLDYKSNSLADYNSQSLLLTMADSHYYLQYLLYSVALHRYLKKRLPAYSWENDIGGVYYLFIRGMSPSDSTQGAGVFFDKPSLQLIEALDALFVREAAHA
jgi:exodeoxyribonuclease V beta subunit